VVKMPRKLIGALALAGLLSAIGIAGAQVPGTSPAPQATPLPPGTLLGIPETMPQDARAAWTQAEWTAQRQHCLSIIAEVDRRHHLSVAQFRTLPAMRHSEVIECFDLQYEFRTPDAPPGPVGGLINPAIPPI